MIAEQAFLHYLLISFRVGFESIVDAFGFALLVKELSSQFSLPRCPLLQQFDLLPHRLHRIQTPRLLPIHHLHRQIPRLALQVAWQQLLVFAEPLDQLSTQVSIKSIEASIVIKESSIMLLIFQQVAS